MLLSVVIYASCFTTSLLAGPTPLPPQHTKMLAPREWNWPSWIPRLFREQKPPSPSPNESDDTENYDAYPAFGGQAESSQNKAGIPSVSVVFCTSDPRLCQKCFTAVPKGTLDERVDKAFECGRKTCNIRESDPDDGQCSEPGQRIVGYEMVEGKLGRLMAPAGSTWEFCTPRFANCKTCAAMAPNLSPARFRDREQVAENCLRMRCSAAPRDGRGRCRDPAQEAVLALPARGPGKLFPGSREDLRRSVAGGEEQGAGIDGKEEEEEQEDGREEVGSDAMSY